MKADPEWLASHGFEIDAELTHQDLLPFIKKYLFRKNPITLFYLFFNVAGALSLVIAGVFFGLSGKCTFGEIVTYVSYGCGIPFLLIPIHEGLHGLAYKYCGAEKVSYDVNWKQLYFMAIADKFVANRKAFYIVGLTPFIVISLKLVAISIIFPYPSVIITMISTIFIHGSMCAGDFGLLSYFVSHAGKEVVTYDDREAGKSYFFIKR